MRIKQLLVARKSRFRILAVEGTPRHLVESQR
jgi:hypothetical protein